MSRAFRFRNADCNGLRVGDRAVLRRKVFRGQHRDHDRQKTGGQVEGKPRSSKVWVQTLALKQISSSSRVLLSGNLSFIYSPLPQRGTILTISVTRYGYYLKQPNYFETFWAILKMSHFNEKTAVTTFVKKRLFFDLWRNYLHQLPEYLLNSFNFSDQLTI